MFFLLLAMLSSALTSIMMRVGTAKANYNLGMLAANYCTCFVAAMFFTPSLAIFPASAALPRTLLLGAVNGVLYLSSFVVFQYNVQKNGVVLSSVFMKLGLLVPMALSILWFGDTPTLLHWIGFSLAIGAILLINLKKTEEKSGSNFGFLLLLLLLGGGANAMSKVFEELGTPAHDAQFLVYTFGVAMLLCLGLVFFKKQRIGVREWLYGFLIGIPNFFSAKFLLAALKEVSAVVAYPTYNVGTILVVSLVGVVAFRERLGKLQWLAVGIIIGALVLLNL